MKPRVAVGLLQTSRTVYAEASVAMSKALQDVEIVFLTSTWASFNYLRALPTWIQSVVGTVQIGFRRIVVPGDDKPDHIFHQLAANDIRTHHGQFLIEDDTLLWEPIFQVCKESSTPPPLEDVLYNEAFASQNIDCRATPQRISMMGNLIRSRFSLKYLNIYLAPSFRPAWPFNKATDWLSLVDHGLVEAVHVAYRGASCDKDRSWGALKEWLSNSYQNGDVNVQDSDNSIPNFFIEKTDVSNVVINHHHTEKCRLVALHRRHKVSMTTPYGYYDGQLHDPTSIVIVRCPRRQ